MGSSSSCIIIMHQKESCTKLHVSKPQNKTVLRNESISIYSISHAHSCFRRVYHLVSSVTPCRMPHTWLIASPHHTCMIFHLTKSFISIHAISLIFEFSDVCVTSIRSKQIDKSLMLGHTHASSLVLKRIQKDILYMICILMMLQYLEMSRFMKIIFPYYSEIQHLNSENSAPSPGSFSGKNLDPQIENCSSRPTI